MWPHVYLKYVYTFQVAYHDERKEWYVQQPKEHTDAQRAAIAREEAESRGHSKTKRQQRNRRQAEKNRKVHLRTEQGKPSAGSDSEEGNSAKKRRM